MPDYCIIANPTSGRGTGERMIPAVVVNALTGALPAHAGGETMALDAKHLEMEVLPGAIELLALPREVL